METASAPRSADRPVALTGATGFIGGRFLARMARAGFPVRALTRRPPPDGPPGVEWVAGDLAGPAALTRLVRGARAVVHCAGAVRGASRAAFDRVNREGAARVARTAAEAGAADRFLNLSSLAARHPELSWYAASKRRGEEAVEGELPAGIRVASFRPTAVYGPGDREMRAFFRLLRRGVLLAPGPRGTRLTLLHVDDLVEAMVAWISAAEPPAGVFELHDGAPEGYGWTDLAEAARDTWGVRVRTVRPPEPFLAAAARANLVLARVVGRAPMLTPGKVREIRHPDWRCRNDALTEALGWVPSVRLRDALREGRTS
ncbi:MAG: NAD-dependent epimerase/dehydratase family protein [Longimicrobiales bacterium]|nr:NAD-dependent epimerase/dehydratase family protein [Longimicrobiales bacterium]